MSYATLARTRNEQTTNPDTYTSTVTDEAVIIAGRSMTSRIDRLVTSVYRFEPMLETRYFSPYGGNVDRYSGQLLLEAPLLEATAVTDSDGTVLTEWDGAIGTLSAATYKVGHLGITPYTALQRLASGDFTTWASPTTSASMITVTGLFGYRRDYTNDGWQLSGDTVQNTTEINATETGLEVTNADGADAYNETPRFSQGNLLRIEDEFVRVLDVDTGTNILNVRRGANGTTAAAHATSTAISVWYPDESIVRICARGAAYMVFRSGRYDNATFDGLGTTSYPADLLKEVNAVMRTYPNLIAPRVV